MKNVRLFLKESKQLNEEPVYDLHPRFDSRKSFYNKAKVDVDNKGSNKLYSYNTLVAEIKNGKPVVYGTYSQTTLRHIKEWLKQLGFKAETSNQIIKDYGVKSESLKESNNEPYSIYKIFDKEGKLIRVLDDRKLYDDDIAYTDDELIDLYADDNFIVKFDYNEVNTLEDKTLLNSNGMNDDEVDSFLELVESKQLKESDIITSLIKLIRSACTEFLGLKTNNNIKNQTINRIVSLANKLNTTAPTTESLKLNETWDGETVIDDIVDRANTMIDEGEDLDEAVNRAINDGLIYTEDIHTLAEHYGTLPEDSELIEGFYDDLYGDVYSKASEHYEEKQDENSEEENECLKEGYFRGCKGVEFIGHGDSADPELEYKGHTFNYYDVEDALWVDFKEANHLQDKDIYNWGENKNLINPEIEDKFDKYVQDNCKNMLNDWIASEKTNESLKKNKFKKHLKEAFQEDYIILYSDEMSPEAWNDYCEHFNCDPDTTKSIKVPFSSNRIGFNVGDLRTPEVKQEPKLEEPTNNNPQPKEDEIEERTPNNDYIESLCKIYVNRPNSLNDKQLTEMLDAKVDFKKLDNQIKENLKKNRKK